MYPLYHYVVAEYPLDGYTGYFPINFASVFVFVKYSWERAQQPLTLGQCFHRIAVFTFIRWVHRLSFSLLVSTPMVSPFSGGQMLCLFTICQVHVQVSLRYTGHFPMSWASLPLYDYVTLAWVHWVFPIAFNGSTHGATLLYFGPVNKQVSMCTHKYYPAGQGTRSVKVKGMTSFLLCERNRNDLISTGCPVYEHYCMLPLFQCTNDV